MNKCYLHLAEQKKKNPKDLNEALSFSKFVSQHHVKDEPNVLHMFCLVWCGFGGLCPYCCGLDILDV